MKKFKAMKQKVEEYLSYRRSLGYKLHIEGQVLLRFANYVDDSVHCGPLTTDIAINWAKSSKKNSRFTWARRLEIVRCFAKYCSIAEPNTQIPEKGIFGKAHRRNTPYIFTKNEVQQILDTTKCLIPNNGLRPISFYYLFGLLYVTGLRISEVVNLSPEDVDLLKGILWIRQTKYHKSRLVPLHQSTVQALSGYCQKRNKYCSPCNLRKFFINDDGSPITLRATEYAFLRIRNLLGWNTKLQNKMPRVYDLRHTFVCHRLLSWYEEGVDIHNVIPYLSTYLGHVKITDTYWYISGVPELMKIASDKFNNNADL